MKVVNTDGTPATADEQEILRLREQMKELQPLPMTQPEFDVWSERIISGALVPADKRSQLFALSSMLLQLSPTESHAPDAKFIHSLRVAAVKEVAHANLVKLKTLANEEIAAANLKQAEEKRAKKTDKKQAYKAKLLAKKTEATQDIDVATKQ